MSKSVKLSNGDYIDAEGIKTTYVSTSGTYITAQWARPSTYPTLTLPYKGIWLVLITFSVGDSVSMPAYSQMSCRVDKNGKQLVDNAGLYFSNIASQGLRAARFPTLVKATANNAVILGYFHTQTANVTLTEYIEAVYLGRID